MAERPSLETYLMGFARHAATRSRDSTQVVRPSWGRMARCG